MKIETTAGSCRHTEYEQSTNEAQGHVHLYLFPPHDILEALALLFKLERLLVQPVSLVHE